MPQNVFPKLGGSTKVGGSIPNMVDDILDPSYASSVLKSVQSANKVKAPSKKELQQQQSEADQQVVTAVTSQVMGNLHAFENYANGSVQRRREIADNYLNNILPQEIAGNAAYAQRPDMATAVRSAIATAINNDLRADEQAVNDASRLGYAWKSLEKGAEQVADNMGIASKALQLRGLNERINTFTAEKERAKQLYDNQVAIDDKAFNDVASERTLTDDEMNAFAQQQVDRASKHKEQMSRYDTDIAQATQARNKAQTDFDLYVMQLMADQAAAERLRQQDNALYAEVQKRAAELHEQDPNYMIGFLNNDHGTAKVIGDLLTQAPQLAASIGAMVATGGHAAPLVLAFNYMQSMGAIGQQTLSEIIDASAETMESIDGYRQFRDDYIKQGESAEDADRLARGRVGMIAVSEHLGTAIAPALLETMAGPTATVAKTGVIKQLTKVGLFTPKKAVAKTATGKAVQKLENTIRRTAPLAISAASEGAEEVAENAAAIYIANDALGSDTSLLDDWLSNFSLGALVGGVFGLPGLRRGGGAATASRAAQNGSQASTAQGPQPDPSQGPSGSAQSAAQGTTQSTTQNASQTVKGFTTDNPFYQSMTPEEQTRVTQAANAASQFIDLMVHSDASFDAKTMPEQMVLDFAAALGTIETTSPNGRKHVNAALDALRQGTAIKKKGKPTGQSRINIDYDQLVQRAVDIQAARATQAMQAQAQQANSPLTQMTGAQVNEAAFGTVPGLQEQLTQTVPANDTQVAVPSAVDTTQTSGATTDVIQGTSQGTGDANSISASPVAATAPAVGQQNAQSNTGSDSAAQSAGIRRSAYEDARAVAENLPSDQSAARSVRFGADGGSSGTVDAPVSPQSGSWDGSTVSQGEQRASYAYGSEDVSQYTDTGRALGVRPTVRDLSQEAQVRLRALDTVQQIDREVTAYNERFEDARKQFETLGMNSMSATLSAALYCRLYSTMQSISNDPFNVVFGTDITSENTLGTFRDTYDQHIYYKVDLRPDQINDLGTVAHELMHAVLAHMRSLVEADTQKRSIFTDVPALDRHAQRLINDFRQVADALGVKPEAVCDEDAWLSSLLPVRGPRKPIEVVPEETATTTYEFYMLGEQEGFSKLAKALTTKAGKKDETLTGIAAKNLQHLYETIRHWMDRIMQELRDYAQWFSIIADGFYGRFTEASLTSVTSDRQAADVIATDVNSGRGRGRIYRVLHVNSESNQKARSTLETLISYLVPRARVVQGKQSDAFYKFFDAVMRPLIRVAPDETATHPEDSVYAYQGAVDAAYLYYVQLGLDQGLAPSTATRRAADRIHEALRLEGRSALEGIQTVDGHTQQVLQYAAIDPSVDAIMTEEYARSTWQAEATVTDQELADLSYGFTDAYTSYEMQVNNPIDEVSPGNAANPVADSAVLDEAQEQAARADLAQRITDAINAPATAPTDLTQQNWFKVWFDDTGIINKDRTPKLLYRVGSRVTTHPTGADLESQVYVRAGNMVDAQSLENMIFANVNFDKNYARKTLNRLQSEVDQGKVPQLSVLETRLLMDMGIDTIKLRSSKDMEPVYILVNIDGASDVAQSYWTGPVDLDVDGNTEPADYTDFTKRVLGLTTVRPEAKVSPNKPDESIEQPDGSVLLLTYKGPIPKTQAQGPQPRTQEEALDAIADTIMAQQKRYQEALERQREGRDELTAAARSVDYTAPQQAGKWIKFATNVRKAMTDASAPLRKWFILNAAPEVGGAETSPAYMSIMSARQRIRGADVEISNKVRRPIQEYVNSVAEARGEDPVLVAKDLGNIRTNLHIIEAAQRQLQELQDALVKAQLMSNDDPVVKARALAQAEKDLDTYKQAQDGATVHDKKTDTDVPVCPLYGGKTVAQAKAELNQLIAKYGDDVAQESVQQFGKAYETIISMLIERGVLSEQDVGNFGMWQFYVPLITKAGYETSIANDEIALFPSKFNWHRGGSLHPAVDSFTALMMMSKRSANNIGTVDLGFHLMDTYKRLEQMYNDGDPSVRMQEFRIGYSGERAGHTYNGLSAFSARVLQDVVADLGHYYNAEQRAAAQRLLDNAALMVRTIEKQTQTQPDGTEQTVETSVPWIIWFNSADLNVKDGQGNAAVEESNADVQQALHDLFHVDVSHPNKIADWAHKATSGMASLNTTYKPWFPPINTVRDTFERLFFTAYKKFRTEDGKAVNGTAVSARMSANMIYAPAIMRAVLTGSTSFAKGQLGTYLQEFKDLGIMSSASLRAALQKADKMTYVYLENAIKQVESGKSLDEVMKNMKRVRGFARTYSEMFYAVPVFAMYKACRDSGISAKDAAYYCTEVANMTQAGTLSKHLSIAFPFTTSIGQTAAQLTSYLGLNMTTFGHAKSAETRRNAFKAYGIFAGTTAVLSITLPIIASMFGDGDDDKGWKILDRMPLHSFSAIPIPLGNNDYLKFPTGFGVLPFCTQLAMGIGRINRGSADIPQVAGDIIGAFVNNVSPLGGPEFETDSVEELMQKLIMTATPMLLQPMTQLVMNKNYWGNSIDVHEIQPDQRKADVNNPRTAQIWKDAAKGIADSLGLDISPEQVRHITTSYMMGPLQGIVQWIESDPLVKDPMYKSTRDELGAIGTALGTTSVYASLGNQDMRDYYDFLTFSDGVIARSGLTKAIKVKPGEKNIGGTRMLAAEKQMLVLTAAGFSPEFVEDYVRVHEMKKWQTATNKEYRERLDNLIKTRADTPLMRAVTDERFIVTNNYLHDQLEDLHFKQGRYNRTDVVIPERKNLVAAGLIEE